MKTTAGFVVAMAVAALPGIHTVGSAIGVVEGKYFPVIGEFVLKNQKVTENGNIITEMYSVKYRDCQLKNVNYYVSGRLKSPGEKPHLQAVQVTYHGVRPKVPTSHPTGHIFHGKIEIPVSGYVTPPRFLYVQTLHECGGIWNVRGITPPLPLINVTAG